MKEYYNYLRASAKTDMEQTLIADLIGALTNEELLVENEEKYDNFRFFAKTALEKSLLADIYEAIFQFKEQQEG